MGRFVPPQEISTKPEAPKHDFSRVEKAEQFINQLQTALKSMTDDELVRLVESATHDWASFQPEVYGIKLPQSLSVETSVEPEKGSLRKVDSPDAVAPQYALLANAAAELWFRKVKAVLNPVAGGEHGDSNQVPLEVGQQQVHRLEQMANILFAGIGQSLITEVKAQLRDHYHYSPDKPDDFLIDVDMSIVQELTTQLPATQRKTNLGDVSPSRKQNILAALERSIGKSDLATRLDVSLVNKKEVRNLSRYGGEYHNQWIGNLKRFVEMSKQSDTSSQPEQVK